MVNKNVGVGFGLVYVLVGVVGFFITGFSGFARPLARCISSYSRWA
jgi:hypothetical protein